MTVQTSLVVLPDQKRVARTTLASYLYSRAYIANPALYALPGKWAYTRYLPALIPHKRRNYALLLAQAIHPNLIGVPNLVGLTQTAASALLASLGLTTGTITLVFNAAAAGIVLAQNPAVGTQLSTGAEVNITVSLGVNPVAGYTLLQDAISILVNAGFVVSQPIQYDFNPTVPAGYVISQSPASLSNVPFGTPVYIRVSAGPAHSAGTAIVPTLTNTMSIVDAADLIMASGCTLAYPVFAIFATSLSVPSGYIISQSPAAGSVVARGTAVSVVVSVGPPIGFPTHGNLTVPNVATHP